MIERNRFSKRQGNVTMMPDEEAAAALEKDITASSSSNLSLGQDITELPPQCDEFFSFFATHTQGCP